MSQPFAFPPPPPPPPPPPKPRPHQNHSDYQQHGSRRGSLGRGGFQNSQQDGRGGGRGGGRGWGQYPARGRGSQGPRDNSMNYSREGHATYTQQPPGPSASPMRQYTEPLLGSGQKRSHTTAFNKHPDHAARNHRPAAPPAVPSFGVDFNTLLPKKPEPQRQRPNGLPKKPNLLGLTPVARDEESEEDDEEEETKLASTISTESLLQFEYKGQRSSLTTPEEIAAWIAERRKKWPTEQKRDLAQREAEERKQKWEVGKLARMEASKAAAKKRLEDRLKQKEEREKSQIRQKLLREQIQKAKQVPTANGAQTAAQAKAERLRRKAEKIAQQLKDAEAALEKHENGTNDDAATEPDLNALLAQVDTIAAAQGDGMEEIDIPDDASDTSGTSTQADASIHDDTSTSGSSSESDSDSAPEESTTKRTAPDLVLAPARRAIPALATDQRPVCKSFAQQGRCKFGRRCRFKHETPGKKDEPVAGNRRKGLYHIMVAKEQEDERKRALKVIIALGEAGVLDQSSDQTEEVPTV